MTAALLAVTLAAPLAAPDHHLKDEKPTDGGIVARVKAAVGDQADRPFLLVVSMTAKQGKARDLIAAYQEAARPSLNEEGCKSYALTRDAENPNRFLLYEKWAGAAALASHLQQPYTKAFVGRFGDLLDESSVSVMRPVGMQRKAGGEGGGGKNQGSDG